MNSDSSSKCSSSSSRSSSIAPQDFTIGNHLIDNHFSSHESQDNPLIIDNIKQFINENENKCRPMSVTNKKWYLRCRVCCQEKSIFFCSDCIKNGDFTYSKHRIPERFAEKKLKYIRLKSDQNLINDKIETLLNNNFIKDELEFKIRSIESNVEELKKNLIKAKQKLNSNENNLKKIKLNQNECRERQTKLESKVKDAKQYLIRRQNAITKMNDSKDNIDSYIKDLVQQRVQQLRTYIFPIEAKDSVYETNETNSILSSESTPLLEPISDSNIGNYCVNFSVVEPWINGNGDNSAFALFASNERDLPNRESNFRNPKYRMCAALSYITQFIYIIAFYLDVRLPKRLSYSEFLSNDLNESEFAQKVAKLNANILYLCLSQNIGSELLEPRRTVRNLLHLLHSSQCLGIRNRPIVFKNDFYEYIEEVLSEDMYLIDETEVDDSVNDQNDENLIIEYDWVENNLPDLQLNMSSQQTSIASGVISTFASVWKAFSSQR